MRWVYPFAGFIQPVDPMGLSNPMDPMVLPQLMGLAISETG